MQEITLKNALFLKRTVKLIRQNNATATKFFEGCNMLKTVNRKFNSHGCRYLNSLDFNSASLTQERGNNIHSGLQERLVLLTISSHKSAYVMTKLGQVIKPPSHPCQILVQKWEWDLKALNNLHISRLK